jgi:GH25 family lysozyme M1 (1,4-beta-N-acetylmuramidase)
MAKVFYPTKSDYQELEDHIVGIEKIDIEIDWDRLRRDCIIPAFPTYVGGCSSDHIYIDSCSSCQNKGKKSCSCAYNQED